jgi:hypothetical protein
VRFIRAGRALIIRDRRMGTHLWFVLTDPDAVTGRVVIVALVTERAHTEKTVRLDVGDHPFITHASNVDFGSSTYAPASKLDAALAERRATLGADMSSDLLDRVRRGLIGSSRAPNEIVSYCKAVFGE